MSSQDEATLHKGGLESNLWSPDQKTQRHTEKTAPLEDADVDTEAHTEAGEERGPCSHNPGGAADSWGATESWAEAKKLLQDPSEEHGPANTLFRGFWLPEL